MFKDFNIKPKADQPLSQFSIAERKIILAQIVGEIVKIANRKTMEKSKSIVPNLQSIRYCDQISSKKDAVRSLYSTGFLCIVGLLISTCVAIVMSIFVVIMLQGNNIRPFGEDRSPVQEAGKGLSEPADSSEINSEDRIEVTKSNIIPVNNVRKCNINCDSETNSKLSKYPIGTDFDPSNPKHWSVVSEEISEDLEFEIAGQFANVAVDRDRGEPHGAAPPTPPGVRVTYQGGSIGLSESIGIESGETGLVEKVIAQGHLHPRVTGHAPETRR